MKKLIIPGIVLLFAGFAWFTSIYSFSVPVSEGGSQSLSAYEGKKILIVTLPVVQSAYADSLLYSLDTLSAAHTTVLKVIAVPSYEDGYTTTQQESLNQWYHSKLGNQVLITGGLYTRKNSGQQHPLFKWLTKVSENENFDIDVEGPWHKFFVSSTGKLYGVLKPHTKMWSAAVQKTLGMGE